MVENLSQEEADIDKLMKDCVPENNLYMRAAKGKPEF